MGTMQAIRRGMGVALVGCLCVLSPLGYGADSPFTLRQRGARLGAEVQATCRQLRAARLLRISVDGGNDISAIVAKFIPPGTTAGDAEAILSAAGYPVAISAEGHLVSRVTVGGGLTGLYGYELAIELSPQAPDDTAPVTIVAANIAARYVPNADRR